MSESRDIIGKLLTDEEVEKIVERMEFHYWGDVRRDHSFALVETDLPALLADRQARIERENKVGKLIAEANLYMIDAAPDYSQKAEERIAEALSLLSQ